MVFDLVGTLAEVKGESEAVDRVLDLFALLFAPQALALVCGLALANARDYQKRVAPRSCAA